MSSPQAPICLNLPTQSVPLQTGIEQSPIFLHLGLWEVSRTSMLKRDPDKRPPLFFPRRKIGVYKFVHLHHTQTHTEASILNAGHTPDTHIDLPYMYMHTSNILITHPWCKHILHSRHTRNTYCTPLDPAEVEQSTGRYCLCHSCRCSSKPLTVLEAISWSPGKKLRNPLEAQLTTGVYKHRHLGAVSGSINWVCTGQHPALFWSPCSNSPCSGELSSYPQDLFPLDLLFVSLCFCLYLPLSFLVSGVKTASFLSCSATGLHLTSLSLNTLQED